MRYEATLQSAAVVRDIPLALMTPGPGRLPVSGIDELEGRYISFALVTSGLVLPPASGNDGQEGGWHLSPTLVTRRQISNEDSSHMLTVLELAHPHLGQQVWLYAL